MQTNKTTKALQSRPRKTICQWLHFIEVSCSCGVWRLCAAANSLWSYWLTLWVCSRGACFYVFGFSLCCALAQQLYLAAEIPQLGRKAGGCGTSGWVEGRKVDQWHHTVSLSCQHQIQGPRGWITKRERARWRGRVTPLTLPLFSELLWSLWLLLCASKGCLVAVWSPCFASQRAACFLPAVTAASDVLRLSWFASFFPPQLTWVIWLSGNFSLGCKAWKARCAGMAGRWMLLRSVINQSFKVKCSFSDGNLGLCGQVKYQIHVCHMNNQ